MREHLRKWTKRILCLAALLAAAGTVLPAMAADAPNPDPSGTATGGIADIIGGSAGAPTGKDIKAMPDKELLAAKVADTV